MNIQNLQKILINNGYEQRYYDMVFELLSNESAQISQEDRQSLFSTIKKQIFYSYNLHINESHYYDADFFVNQFFSLNTFHNVNKFLHEDKEYQQFFHQNFMPIVKEEINNFFTKESMIYKSYDDYNEQQIDISIYFLSPTGLYNSFKTNDLFVDLLESDIKPALLDMENQYLKTENPVIKEGLLILDKSLENPKYFSEFIPFWNRYKKMLLPSNSIESDLEIISQVHPSIHDDYCEYITKKDIHYEFEKSILSRKISQFYFEHFEDFISYAGKIPNPLVWIYESRKFLATQNFIDNIEEKHFEYFKNFNHSSFFEKFITGVLFAQNFSSDVSYEKIKSLLSKNFQFENLFQHFEIDNPSSENLSNFENYLLKLNNDLKTNDLLAFYRNKKLENKLTSKSNFTKKIKI